jgi:transposase
MRLYWSEKENSMLKENYNLYSKYELQKILPNRTWNAIILHAQKLGLKRCSDLLANTNPSILLQETPETYYWIGFLLADGNFKNKRLKLVLSKKDHKQIYKFATFIGIKETKENSFSCAVSIQHSAIYKLIEKFGISTTKTYNPPNLEWLEGDLFLALLIGFIDGDGSIIYQTNRNDCKLAIKVHSSWLETLNVFSLKLHNLIGIPYKEAKINSVGYAELNISNSIVLKFIKRNAQRLNLPTMERKWERINLSTISKAELGKYRINQVQILLNENLSKTKIANVLGVSNSTITMIIKRNNLIAYKGKMLKGGIYDKQ